MSDIQRWGATPEEWANFDLLLGLTPDLLPVVSNPQARVSPKSSLRSLGKTPSQYNADGLVVGIPNWTQRETTAEDIALWQKQADYGICIQTRRLRAIDIDVEDPKLAMSIVGRFERQFGRKLPRRWRENSGKCLLAFLMPGGFPKRSFKVDGGGQVEFLGDGQQFVAAGVHPSGARYQWS